MTLKNLFKSFAQKKANRNVHGSSKHFSHKSPVPVFLLCMLFGSLGAHCFWAGRRTRGVQYLIWGGLVFALIYFAYAVNQAIIPTWIVVLGLVSACIVQLIVIRDLWKISRGKYKRRKSGRPYKPATWMLPFAIIMTALTAFSIFMVSTFMVDNILEKGRPSGAAMELEVETYMKAQQSFFDKNGKIGTMEEIGYHPKETKFRYFEYKNSGKGLKITHLLSINCPYKTTWMVEPSVHDSTLLWKVTLPQNLKCNSMVRQIASLEKKEQARADSTIENSLLQNKSVSEDSVATDSTQQIKTK